MIFELKLKLYERETFKGNKIKSTFIAFKCTETEIGKNTFFKYKENAEVILTLQLRRRFKLNSWSGRRAFQFLEVKLQLFLSIPLNSQTLSDLY